MAKAVVLIASFLCILALAGFAHCHQHSVLKVEGKVYCDTCRFQFETKISENIHGAHVRLECRERHQGKLTYSIEGVTDANGQYSLEVEGDHEEEICEVSAVKSPLEHCNEAMVGMQKARVSCALNSGIVDYVRYANPLGFMKAEPLSTCKTVLDDMGFLPVVY